MLVAPEAAIATSRAHPPSGARAFFGAAVWLGLCPPLFAYIGTMLFGWRLGVEPLFLPAGTVARDRAWRTSCCCSFGFLSTAVVARWMASTYGADTSCSRSLALVTLVGTPLAVGSVVHLYPNAFVNVLVLVPTLIWSMYLLYRGLPVVLKTDPGRGMLMASSLIAYLLVSWVTLLGITAVLWSRGIGPRDRDLSNAGIGDRWSSTRATAPAEHYEDRIVTAFTRLLDRLGDARHGGRCLRRGRARLAASSNFGHAVAVLRPAANRRTRISCCSASACRP